MGGLLAWAQLIPVCCDIWGLNQQINWSLCLSVPSSSFFLLPFCHSSFQINRETFKNNEVNVAMRSRGARTRRLSSHFQWHLCIINTGTGLWPSRGGTVAVITPYFHTVEQGKFDVAEACGKAASWVWILRLQSLPDVWNKAYVFIYLHSLTCKTRVVTVLHSCVVKIK